eukprot:scaffold90764_cov32-Tisochrysis_lutea.AAC.2
MGAWRSLLLLVVLARTCQCCEVDLISLLISLWRRETSCRAPSLGPHQNGLWRDSFPTSEQPLALCEGSITVESTGEICVTGRVSYKQIAEAVGRPIYSPAAPTISINGHLVTGSANVVLGANARFLYDFVTLYEVDGVQYTPDSMMVDRVLAASRGTIDKVCLNSSFAPNGPDGYTITSKRWEPKAVDVEEFASANIAFISTHSIVAEYHEEINLSGVSGGLLYQLSHPAWLGGSSIGEAFGLFLFNLIANLPLPTCVTSLIPGVLGLTSLLRRLLIQGTFSLERHPLPLEAPDSLVENIQVDTEWDTLLQAMRAGLFSAPNVPFNLAVVIKRIQPTNGTFGCWDVPAAAIDIQAPVGWHDMLDGYVADEVYPALSAIGSVGLHFGKRIPAQSAVLQAALNKYSTCGASLNLSPAQCIHPMCERTPNPTTFEYPARYYSKRMG